MATFIVLNRLRRCLVSKSSLSQARQFHFLSNPNPTSSGVHNPLRRPFLRRDLAGSPLGPFGHRTLFDRSGDDSEFAESLGVDAVPEMAAESKVLGSCLPSGFEDSIFPIRALVSMLDGFHDLTGFPWWLVICSSILGLRVTLLPLLFVQLRKLKRIKELFHKLPPPLPPPRSRRSYVDHFSLYFAKKKQIGCPSFLWFLPYVSVQLPSFFLWMISIRRMSLNEYPGFDCGGALWFQDLTSFSHGPSGCIFPLVIAGFHYTNVQLSLQKPPGDKPTNLLGLYMKYYKIYLNFLTLPILLTCFFIPQGSLVYWATNSSLTFIQLLVFKTTYVRAKLGILDPTSIPRELENETENETAYIENLTPRELISVSSQLLSERQTERAIYMLQLALNKDPECTFALILIGQSLLQKGLIPEAIKYLERVVSKLTLDGHPIEEQDNDYLIHASLWMGSAHCYQKNFKEGIVHFERIRNLKEPINPEMKNYYYDGFLMLSSALHNVGQKEEALKYLRLAATHNPAYNKYLEQCETGDDPFAELANSRRAY